LGDSVAVISSATGLFQMCSAGSGASIRKMDFRLPLDYSNFDDLGHGTSQNCRT
jgi:hypothetical protein